MAQPSTDNNGTTFYNQNQCRSFNFAISSTLQRFVNEVCSEVIIINKTGKDVLLYDSDFFAPQFGILVEDNDSITLRGLTNASQVSAVAATNGGTLYYRTQWYSLLPQR